MRGRLDSFFPTLAIPFHATHHRASRRFTSAGHLPHPWEILRLVTQRSSEHFYRKDYVCRLTTFNPDGSFADFHKALRTRLNIPKDEPLVVKQIDGDYMLDIETGSFLAGPYVLVFYIEPCARTEEDYEAFCHFAKSASQLHISVNGGMRNQLKVMFPRPVEHPRNSQRNKDRRSRNYFFKCRRLHSTSPEPCSSSPYRI